MTRSLSFDELFDADFLHSLERLRIVARRVARGGRPAEQRSADLGSGLEFRDYRPYVPGDDLRAVDWNIYRRLGKVFIRLFEEVEDLPVYLMPDLSPSMFHEDPPRIHAGLRSALAIASIALSQHDSVGLLPFSADLELRMRARGGKGRLMTFARRLSELRQGDATDFARALKRLDGMGLRRGLLVVISDFFDPRGVEAMLDPLSRTRHRLLLLQMTRASDRDPALQGDVRLVDCETGGACDVSITDAARERYREVYDRFTAALTTFARNRGCGLAAVDIDRDVVDQLAGLFEAGAYVT